MSKPRLELSVILPVYNEGEIIHRNLEAVKIKLDSLGLEYEIIVVNDGSLDDTLAQARLSAGKRVSILTYELNRGKGYAVHYGMTHASGEYKLFMDVDLATSLNEIPKFLLTIKYYHFDVLIGNRKVEYSSGVVKQPFYRQFFGKGFTWLSCSIIGCKLMDFTCGFKMFKSSAADIIFARQRIFNWAFDTELICIALCQKLVIHEIPVEWNNRVNSRVRLLRDIISSLIGVTRIWLNRIRGHYR